MRILLLGFSAILIAGAAYGDAPRDALGAMVKCAEISDPAERLKCFDAAIPGAKNALSTPEKPAEKLATPEKPPEKSLLDWFGFNRPPQPVTRPEDFGKPAPEPAPGEAITEIKATVLEYARTRRGKLLFVLDNGQVWRQLDGDSTEVRDPPPDTVWKVTIETGVLGSYNLIIDGRNSIIKVSRVK
jgi:hypothetical protein